MFIVFISSLLGLMTQKQQSAYQLQVYLLDLFGQPLEGKFNFVESTSMAGKGDLHLTGQLGDVIKESAHIALTWVYPPSFICLFFIYSIHYVACAPVLARMSFGDFFFLIKMF